MLIVVAVVLTAVFAFAQEAGTSQPCSVAPCITTSQCSAAPCNGGGGGGITTSSRSQGSSSTCLCGEQSGSLNQSESSSTQFQWLGNSSSPPSSLYAKSAIMVGLFLLLFVGTWLAVT